MLELAINFVYNIFNKLLKDALVMYESFNQHKNGAEYLTSPLFDSYGIPHMFSTKNGGVSEGVFSSLNMSFGNGEMRDSRENVEENHRIAAEALGSLYEDLARTKQTHSNTVKIVESKDKGRVITKDKDGTGVDGLVTEESDILLCVRMADCVPVLLYDTKHEVCAAVHSGWRGTLGEITSKAVDLMKESFGTEPSSLIAAIGPSAKSCCYEVGEEIYSAFVAQNCVYEKAFDWRDGKLFLSVGELVKLQLLFLGVTDDKISISPLCTICNPELFFSHRRQGTARGTMAAFIKKRK